MEADKQYSVDCARLAVLIARYTGISEFKIFTFITENAASEMLSCANTLCSTDAEREKLYALFEFKGLYEAIKGSEKGRAHQLNTGEAAKAYFISLFAEANDRERFSVAFLDIRCQVIATKTLFAGTIDHSSVHSREIIKEALFHNAAAVMLVHNHPSGNAVPSKDDIALTRRLWPVLEDVGIKLLDHFIVAGDKAESLAELGYIPETGSADTSKSWSKVAINEQPGVYSMEAKKTPIRGQLAAAKKQLAEERADMRQGVGEKMKSQRLEL